MRDHDDHRAGDPDQAQAGNAQKDEADVGHAGVTEELVQIALALKDAFGLKDVNELPLSFDLAWYEQKAALILLSLLALGIRNIHLGPTLPAFVSPNVLKILVDKFNIQQTTTVEQDLPLVLAGK